ncbi:hypothetical protein DEJ50_21015 [Streptomyces venezuelae]|uniref:Uncharacterized protein n=1 Tax=Streptomyces venezuelae TaxID=54571 RepID=A0A5P2D6X8_STRVZ|nr:DUF1707 domain-containing protein [Streptomyces venezuelae]QES49937.1 hypothetical protein DEJ50_21015 [Streptomyces venezuelae]
MDLDKHPAASAAPAQIRASDADRDRIAQILGDALAEGRLTAEEHSERLDVLYAVKTVGELDALVRDLPAGAAGRPGAYGPAGGLPAGPPGDDTENVIAVCSGQARRGRWRPGPRTRAVAVMGDITLDLTEAVFEQQLTEINVTCILGSAEILVPENVTLRGFGNGVLGNFDIRGESRGETDPQAPVVVVRGFALLGSIEARPKPGARLVDLAHRMRQRHQD